MGTVASNASEEYTFFFYHEWKEFLNRITKCTTVGIAKKNPFNVAV